MKYIENLKSNSQIDKRISDFARFKQKYPDRIPVIVDSYSEKSPSIDNHKFLVPNDITLAQFMYIIRKRVKINPDEALYFFIGSKKIMETASKLMSEIYKSHSDEDKFLYIYYDIESTFGHILF
jgi:GABA(A) receptor-associated protein